MKVRANHTVISEFGPYWPAHVIGALFAQLHRRWESQIGCEFPPRLQTVIEDAYVNGRRTCVDAADLDRLWFHVGFVSPRERGNATRYAHLASRDFASWLEHEHSRGLIPPQRWVVLDVDVTDRVLTYAQRAFGVMPPWLVTAPQTMARYQRPKMRQVSVLRSSPWLLLDPENTEDL